MPTTKSKPTLEIKNVTKKFGGLVAINNLSFHVDQGEILGLVGPNGSGKTTLFNVITGEYSLNSGRVKFNGQDITNAKSYELVRKGIRRTFQTTRLFFNFPVIWNMVTSQGSVLKKHGENQMQRAVEILERMKLGHVNEKLAKNLTHAEQRILMIAMALTTEPRLLLLDEPSSGMSVGEITGLMKIIEELVKSGTTILLIEHDMRIAMGVSDRMVVIDFGKKIAEGTPREISKNEAVIEAYLGRGEF